MMNNWIGQVLFVAVTAFLGCQGRTYYMREGYCGNVYSPRLLSMSTSTHYIRSQVATTYPFSMDCTTTIRAPLNYRVQITFTKFFVRAGCGDRLFVYDGATTRSRLVATYCGYGINRFPSPSYYSSSGRYLTIRFLTDRVYDHMAGFILRYTPLRTRLSGGGGYSGLRCYTCSQCSAFGYIEETGSSASYSYGCYACMKIWQTALPYATRSCATSVSAVQTSMATYTNNPSFFIGCQNFTTVNGVTEVCVCRSSRCNGATPTKALDWFLFLTIGVAYAAHQWSD